MISDPWTARLSDYIDGDLGDTERAALERHLGACPACTATLADLVRVVELANRLPDRPPATDLWTGIAARLGDIPPASVARPRPRRRWTFSLPQLAAAAAVIAVASGGGAWWLALRAPGSTVAPAPIVSATPQQTARPAPLAEVGYDAAVADLEQVLDAGRGTLDTATVRVIEQNLAVIDRALADARRALAADPGNAYLNAHLAHTMRRKLDLLRRAATIVATRS